MLYNFYYCGICSCLPNTVIFAASEAMVTSKQPQWPRNDVFLVSIGNCWELVPGGGESGPHFFLTSVWESAARW